MKTDLAGADEMAQQLRAGPSIAEGLRWVSGNHTEQLILPVTLMPGDPMPLASAVTHTHTHKSTHRNRHN